MAAAGRHRDGRELGSADDAGELDIPFKQKADAVGFTVPKVGIYEIAVVSMQ